MSTYKVSAGGFRVPVSPPARPIAEMRAAPELGRPTRPCRYCGNAIVGGTGARFPETFEEQLRREDRESLERSEAGERGWPSGVPPYVDCGDRTAPGFIYCGSHLRMHLREGGARDDATIAAVKAELEAQEESAQERMKPSGAWPDGALSDRSVGHEPAEPSQDFRPARAVDVDADLGSTATAIRAAIGEYAREHPDEGRLWASRARLWRKFRAIK